MSDPADQSSFRLQDMSKTPGTSSTSSANWTFQVSSAGSIGFHYTQDQPSVLPPWGSSTPVASTAPFGIPASSTDIHVPHTGLLEAFAPRPSLPRVCPSRGSVANLSASGGSVASLSASSGPVANLSTPGGPVADLRASQSKRFRQTTISGKEVPRDIDNLQSGVLRRNHHKEQAVKVRGKTRPLKSVKSILDLIEGFPFMSLRTVERSLNADLDNADWVVLEDEIRRILFPSFQDGSLLRHT
jgi:hypothetical protein